MTAQVLVVTGPAQSGKTQRVLTPFADTLRTLPPQSTLWLAPNGRAVSAVCRLLLQQGGPGWFSPGVATFDRLAESAVRAAPFVIHPLDSIGRRRLVGYLVRERLADDRLLFFRPLAEMGGLVDLVCSKIRDLKRREIWPGRFRRLVEARGMPQRDAELLEFYEAYQQLLARHQLYDAEGWSWVARQMMREGRWAPLDRLRTVVVDGFADFTIAQHEILEQLARRCEALFVTLPLDDAPCRGELFARPAATLEELKRRHPDLKHERLERLARPAWKAFAHLEAALFGNPRQPRPSPDTAGLEILAASRQSGELELIGSRIRRLLTEGCPRSGGQPVRPDDIAVVFRSVEEIAPLVREVFGKLRIPIAVELTESLERVSTLAALVSLLRLDVDDWPFRALLAVLTSNYFRPEWPEWAAGESAVAVERAVRQLQVPRGRELLLGQLRSRLSPDVRPPGGDPAGPTEQSQTQTAVRVLGRLAKVLDEMPRRATLRQWSEVWQRLARKTGLLAAARETSVDEAKAWTALGNALLTDDILFRWMRVTPPELDRAEALTSLVDLLRHTSSGSEVEEPGRVRVLSAASVRGLQVPYLFVAGLAERAFPLPVRQALTEEASDEGDHRRDPQAAHRRAEMLLFYQVVTRATRQLVFSYPGLDEAAQPLAPSPYLEEVEQACGPGTITRTEVPDLTPIPREDRPNTAAEFRIKAVHDALAGQTQLLAAMVRQESSPGLTENLLAGIRLTRARESNKGFGPFEGMLVGPAVRELFRAAFGPVRVFSATELERYAYCPYRYLIQQVMHLAPLEDLGLEVDYLARGRVVHEALATFHERINQSQGRPTSPAALPPDEYQRLASETLDSLFGRHAEGTVQAAMEEIDRRLWRQWIEAYRLQHERYDALWQTCEHPLVPAAFEVSFGLKAPAGPLSTERPLEIAADGQTVRISGRIDRIDVGKVGDRAVFNVIDCKTGTSARLSAEAIANGTLLQLPLYAMAVEELLLADQKAAAWQAGYWEIQGDGFKAKSTLRMHAMEGGHVEPDPQWHELRSVVARTIAALVTSMRAGEFPVYSPDEHCTRRCPMKTICRIHQIRSLEKQWQASCEQV